MFDFWISSAREETYDDFNLCSTFAM